MINSISWASYLYALGIAVCLYYMVVCVLFYRAELLNIFYKLKGGPVRNETYADSMPEQYAIDVMNHADNEGNHDTIRDLLLNIQSLARAAAAGSFTKEKILTSIQLQLKFQDKISSKLKDSINHFIMAACKTYCSIHLEEMEVVALWDK